MTDADLETIEAEFLAGCHVDVAALLAEIRRLRAIGSICDMCEQQGKRVFCRDCWENKQGWINL